MSTSPAPERIAQHRRGNANVREPELIGIGPITASL
jgi:hypothetical protein